VRFILVDKIRELVPGGSVVAEKTIPPGEDFLADHFPGFPVVPAVILTEMMAQAAGKCFDAERRPRGKAMLARINAANFRAWVAPGRLCVIRAEVRADTDHVGTAACSIDVDAQRVCDADLLFAFVPMERFAPDYVDDVLASYLSKA
jgi:3-hydroxyacyl-[acyl-carrier-protein] dehydratase